MELVELHVLERQAMAVSDRRPVARQGIGVGRDLEHPAEPAGGQEHALGVENVELAGGDLQRDDAAAFAVLEDQVDHMVLVEEGHPLLDALLIEGLKDHVSGPVGRVAGPHDRDSRLGSLGTRRRRWVVFRVGLGVAAEPALRDPALGRAVEWQAHVLQVVDALDRLSAEDLGGGLVDQEVASLDRIVGVVLPRVVLEVGERRGDPSLRRPGVRPCGIELAHHRRAHAPARLQGRHQARPAGPHDHAIKSMVIVHGA